MLQTHHILLQELAGHFTLKVLGDRFRLDGIKNLMSLPSNQKATQGLGSSPHTGGHLGSYRKVFCKFLGELQEHPSFVAAQEGDTAALDQLDAEMSGFLAAAKHALARGHLLANTPSGRTQEEANKNNEDWYANRRTYAKDNQDSIQQMQDTVDQLHAAGQWDGALRAPILLPDGGLSLADKIELLKRYGSSSGISQHFSPVGPVPDLPGFAAPAADVRLPGFIPPSTEGLNRPEGFTPGNPLPTLGVPGFPVINPQGFEQLPPTTAVPQDPFIFKYDLASGTPHPFYENPLAGGTSVAHNALPWLAGAAAVGIAAPSIPAWLLAIGGALALTRAATAGESSSGTRTGAAAPSGGVFSTGAPPLNIIGNGLNVDSAASGRGSSASSTFGRQVGGASSIDPETRATTFADRFGSWAGTPGGTVPAKPANVDRLPDAPAGGSVAPENVRRLARVNESNAGSVFTSGSAPVPYLLPSTEFNERFGNWTVATTGSAQPQPSKPIGLFADEPSYVIPPPIFGVDGPGNPHSDAEEWFSRWIRPLLRPE
ncbi:hypothetical protein [Bradyrhizobium sp. WSM2793]|uniref:hypothetical protein n=1 Tax=Bradyrhizobium sp. WSM2793 TaxID=1038866 RepID=UPI0003A5A9DD|nr:hypothetical protein [Bradyrhizobium sp. WSM2793]